MRFLRRTEREKGRSSEDALKEATEQLEKIKARDPEVKEIAGTSRRLRVENHFGEKLTLIIQGHKGGT
jgi:hypothetical protein